MKAIFGAKILSKITLYVEKRPKNHWLTSLPPSFPTKLRKLEITLVPLALKMIFTLLQILQILTSLGKFLRRLLIK